jgi:hypothetical protein
MRAWSKIPKEKSPYKRDADKTTKSKGMFDTLRKSGFDQTVSDKTSTVKHGKHEEKKLELEALNQCYEEYIKQEENLSGVLNTKTMGVKNLELKEKLNYWRESKDLRDLTESKIKLKVNEVLGVFNKYVEDLTIDKDKVEACRDDFLELLEEKKKWTFEENTLNDFLLGLRDFKLLEINDLRK